MQKIGGSMDRGEFLSLLRESLAGVIPMEEVEKNITFYRNYFEEAGKSEQEVIEELGDPRLIARTIIDAYKASKGPMADYYTEQARSEYSREHSRQYEGSENKAEGGLAWYERAFGWIIMIGVLAVVLILTAKIIGIFVGFVLPVLLLVILLRIIIGQFRK